MYGLSGAWCWIRFTKGHDRLGLAYQIGMWYGPLILVLLITFLATVILVVPLCWGAFCSHPEEIYQQHHRKALKEALPLIIYPIIYNIVCCRMLWQTAYIMPLKLYQKTKIHVLSSGCCNLGCILCEIY